MVLHRPVPVSCVAVGEPSYTSDTLAIWSSNDLTPLLDTFISQLTGEPLAAVSSPTEALRAQSCK